MPENEAMEMLAISSWKNLSKDKFMNFLAILPDLDKETQFRAIEQIPNIVNYIMDANEKIIEASKGITEKNKETTHAIINSLKEMQLCFQEQLKIEDSLEGKMFFSEKLMENAKILVELDKENKGFLERHFGLITSACVLGLGVVAWIISGRSGFKS